MNNKTKQSKVLLVDDEQEFRTATGKALERRGFEVIQAGSGEEAAEIIPENKPDIVVLDLVMPGMNGIETLTIIRKIDAKLPVIILTGHGTYHDAIAGIKMEIVDFLQKPVDIDLLAMRIKNFIEIGVGLPLRERTIAELMVSPSIYPRLDLNAPVNEAVTKLLKAFFPESSDIVQTPRFRSAIVYNSNEEFIGLIRFTDLLKLVLPSFLGDSPYSSYFTGMFLAQCKMIGQRSIFELMGKRVTVEVGDPLMLAVHLMVENGILTIPVMKAGELVGILRERDIIIEIAKYLGVDSSNEWFPGI
ncbi:MAG: response regulator [FCB group bacterium]|nr:response regulator [FCB group bacterium]